MEIYSFDVRDAKTMHKQVYRKRRRTMENSKTVPLHASLPTQEQKPTWMSLSSIPFFFSKFGEGRVAKLIQSKLKSRIPYHNRMMQRINSGEYTRPH